MLSGEMPSHPWQGQSIMSTSSTTCDCCRKTAYWSNPWVVGNLLQTNRRLQRCSALTELSCPQETQTFAVSAAAFALVDYRSRFFCLFAGYKTLELHETPSVAHRVCELWFRIQWVSRCASSIPESGLYLSMCESSSSAQCTGIWLHQLLVSRQKCLSAGCQQVS